MSSKTYLIKLKNLGMLDKLTSNGFNKLSKYSNAAFGIEKHQAKYYNPNIDFKTIKIRAEISAIFEIQ